ncbi:tyrosine-type recombinase/integrase, partial [Desulfovibrio sp. OttesenSCG-928-C14]|nr:tyrosine-type recombinase/integrase [Desulfovibrio sp. OttesenSCG-928-C14]
QIAANRLKTLDKTGFQPFCLYQESSQKDSEAGIKSGKFQGKPTLHGGIYPMTKKPLTDTALKALKPKDKLYKVPDGTIGGLHVAVSPKGKKVFRLAYKFEGKAQLLTFGAYPMFSLVEARELARDTKKQVATGTNPAAAKKAEKTKLKASELPFRLVAAQWLALGQKVWAVVTEDDTVKRLEKHILPSFGDKPISEVTKADIKGVLDHLYAQGKHQTLKKVRGTISQILRYAIDTEIPGVEMDWTEQLRRQYPNLTSQEKHRAAITDPRQVKGLMKAIAAYEKTSLLTHLALRFSVLTFARPGEIRQAEWKEIDWDNELWRIPAEKMKMRQPHLVPLATQTLDVLERLLPLSGQGRYLFPSVRTEDRPMSEATITAALRRMGYGKEEICAHGFRGMASTLLNEKGHNRDWIERQLAHGAADSVRAAYNHADFLEGRRKMMQWWANYLDKLQMR